MDRIVRTMMENLNFLDGRGTPTTRTHLRRMRRTPVYYDPVGQVWGIFKHDDVLAIEKDPKTFSSHRAPGPTASTSR